MTGKINSRNSGKYNHSDFDECYFVISLENGVQPQPRTSHFILLRTIFWEKLISKLTGSLEKPKIPNWKLHQIIFQNTNKHSGCSTVYIIESRLYHQLPQCVAWNPNSNSRATDLTIKLP